VSRVANSLSLLSPGVHLNDFGCTLNACRVEVIRLREDQLQRDALNQQKAELIVELDKQKQRIDSLLEELATLRQHLDTLTKSRLWRMTAPLRAAADAFKKFRQGSA
jgi:hypothetical protein